MTDDIAPPVHEPIADAADLPADVKNGEVAPGEDDPAINHEPPTEENA